MNTQHYEYELTVRDNDGQQVCKRSTPFPEIVERLVDDAKKTIEDFWNDKKALSIDNHDCHAGPEDGCGVCSEMLGGE